MSRTERVYKIELLVRHGSYVSFERLRQALEVSPATLKRDIEYLRDRLGAPIVYDRFHNGYTFACEPRGARHELPGLWFSERELYALLASHRLLDELDAEGVISRHLQPLLDRIHQMLGSSEAEADALRKRVKIVATGRRPVPSRFFELLGEALIRRRRVRMRYLTRSRGELGEREVSPLRLVHYRNTWYLDAWCHQRERLLRFALDAIEDAGALDKRAKEVSIKRVEAEMDAGYGVYAGADPHWVTLAFSAQAAQWVSREQWHRDQRATWQPDGRYQLELPYVDPSELAMDILRHAGEVEIVADSGTVGEAVRERLRRAWERYAAVPIDGQRPG